MEDLNDKMERPVPLGEFITDISLEKSMACQEAQAKARDHFLEKGKAKQTA